jgi:hypothetical protein
MVAETYCQIYFTDKSLEIVDKNIRILDDFITLAETKYSVGQGAQQDVFKAQVERSKMLDMRITPEQQRKSLEAGMKPGTDGKVGVGKVTFSRVEARVSSALRICGRYVESDTSILHL